MTNAQKKEMLKLRVIATLGGTSDKAKYIRFVAEHCGDEELMCTLLMFFIDEVLSASDDD